MWFPCSSRGSGRWAPAFLELAQDLGANAWQRWRRVILPVMAAPAATSFLFVFILSAADYVMPQLIGGTSGQMLGVQIQANFKAVGDWPQGAAISILMLLAFHCLLWRDAAGPAAASGSTGFIGSADG